MKFNSLNQTHIGDLQSIVSPDRFSIGESNLDLHGKDQSRHPLCPPEAVIWPINRSEVSEILRYANRHLIPVTGWGSGSSLSGNPIPVKRGVVLNFSQMNHILEIREEDFQADVEPGVIYQDLNEKLRHKGLFFTPDPGSKATLGGMIANNASGTRTVRYGSTKDHVLRLSVVMADGEMIEVGTRASKSSSGYDLLHLFVGSEGTLGIVVEATVRLVGYPEEYSTVTANFSTVRAAGKAVFEIIRAGIDPAALELLDSECIELFNKDRNLGLKASPFLFMEFHGPSKNQLVEMLEMVQEICNEHGCDDFRASLEMSERDELWKARREVGEIITRNHPGCDIVTDDVAVPISTFPEMIAFAREESQKIPSHVYIWSHAGDGNLHMVFMCKEGDEKELEIVERVNHSVVSRALELGGTATGEHGVGLEKRKFMMAEHGSSLEWMKKIKSLFDPKSILNPDKIFP